MWTIKEELKEYGKLLPLRTQGDNTNVLILVDHHNLLTVSKWEDRGTSKDSALNYIPKSKMGTASIVASKHFITFSLRFQSLSCANTIHKQQSSWEVEVGRQERHPLKNPLPRIIVNTGECCRQISIVIYGSRKHGDDFPIRNTSILEFLVTYYFLYHGSQHSLDLLTHCLWSVFLWILNQEKNDEEIKNGGRNARSGRKTMGKKGKKRKWRGGESRAKEGGKRN